VNRLQGEHYSNCTNEEDYTPENPDFAIPGLYTLQVIFITMRLYTLQVIFINMRLYTLQVI